MNINRIFLKTALAACFISAPLTGVFSLAAHADTVYKHTDESGRISYSNTPRKGAVIVDLGPLTLMQGVPLSAQTPIPARPISGMLRQPQNLAAANAANAASETSAQSPNLQNLSNAISSRDASLSGAVDKTVDNIVDMAASNAVNIATDGAASSPITPAARISFVPVLTTSTAANSQTAQNLTTPTAISLTQQFATAPNAAVAGGQSAATMASQRRENVRRRLLEGEIEAEDQLLVEARQTLVAEQARSPAMRALRSALPNEIKPSETTKESRALIERHFARVRDLQDQLTMHDDNIAELRGMLAQVGTSSLRVRAPGVTKTPANLAVVSATPSPISVGAKADASLGAKVNAKADAKATAKEAKSANQTVNRASSTITKPLIAATQSDGATADDTTNLHAVSQLPVVKLRPAAHTNNAVSPAVSTSVNANTNSNAASPTAAFISATNANTNANANTNTNPASTATVASASKRNMAEDR